MDEPLADLVVAAARHIRADAWVFVGFGWPVLASRVARRLGTPFTEVYEAGAACSEAAPTLATSTTDYAAYMDVTRWVGSTMDVLALVNRLDVVMLDAPTVDVTGAVDTFGTGPAQQPTARLAGGGGSADVAARARTLVLLHAAPTPDRLVLQHERATAVPGEGTKTVLLTRWGSVRLGSAPRLLAATDASGTEGFLHHLDDLGVDTSRAEPADPCGARERAAAVAVLEEAATRGHQHAARALSRHAFCPASSASERRGTSC